MAAYNFFPTESSGVASFFLMFGHEAAVKHTLLESERQKYLGTDDRMINIEIMTQLYHVMAHNLNEARKARDRNRKGKTPKEPEKLKKGDNVHVRDHTSKAFQPKYKDFCIVGLLGKNQVEIKDNHGHTYKVHCRDVKKIPMTEKVCQLYEEEQIGKGREGRKAVLSSKMPDLRWEISETTRISAQSIKTTTVKISRNKLFKNIMKSCQMAVLAVNIVTSTTDHTNHRNQCTTQPVEILRIPQARENPTMSTTGHTGHTHPIPTMVFTISTTSCKTVSQFMLRLS